MEHKLIELKRSHVHLVGDDIVPDPFSNSETVIGCELCNMALDEAKTCDCIGVPLERLLED